VSARQRRLVAAAAALVLLGAIALAASLAFDDERRPERSGANVAVNSGARDPADISANNSPSLARHPRQARTLAIVNRIDSPDYSCALQVSRDGGARWSHVAVPIPDGAGRKCYAPDATFTSDGTLVVSYVTLRGSGNEPHAVWVARSTDGGRTLSEPVRAAGPLAFQVRLTADPRRPQRLYLTWLQPDTVGLFLFSGSKNRIVVARSDDGGRSWGNPVSASDPQRQRVLAPSAQVGTDGALYVLYLDVGDDRLDFEGAHGGFGGRPYGGRFSLVLGRSTDAGATWTESLVDDRVTPTRRFVAFLPPSPSLAVDADGRIYVAFEDGEDSPSDVHLWSLGRGEADWKGPVRVNDTPAGERTSQYLPRIAVAPDGRVDVAYYDRRNDSTDTRNEVSLQSSFDAGETFTPHTTLTDRAFDSRVGPGNERRLPDLGSRIALASQDASVLAAWTDTRAGTEASVKQDIAFAKATVVGSGLSQSGRAALRVCAIVLLLAGAALLIVQARRPGV
jgi:hypothetical protein